MQIDGHDGIKVLIFDLGGVFIDLDIARCVENFAKIGFKNAAAFLNTHKQSAFFGDFDMGMISSAEFRNIVRGHAGNPALTDAQIDDAWTSLLVALPRYKLEFVQKIKANFDRLVLLSNTNEIDWLFGRERFFKEQGFLVEELFDKCYLSFELKVSKPNPAIFEKILENEGVAASDCLLVDDAVSNCEAARALGMKALQVSLESDWRHFFV